jgi:hypothetical protein
MTCGWRIVISHSRGACNTCLVLIILPPLSFELEGHLWGTYLCCAKIPFSFEVDRYNGQPANNRLPSIYALLPEREPSVIVGLETAVEMNLVRIGTSEFFPNSPLLNSRKPSTSTFGG